MASVTRGYKHKKIHNIASDTRGYRNRKIHVIASVIWGYKNKKIHIIASVTWCYRNREIHIITSLQKLRNLRYNYNCKKIVTKIIVIVILLHEIEDSGNPHNCCYTGVADAKFIMDFTVLNSTMVIVLFRYNRFLQS